VKRTATLAAETLDRRVSNRAREEGEARRTRVAEAEEAKDASERMDTDYDPIHTMLGRDDDSRLAADPADRAAGTRTATGRGSGPGRYATALTLVGLVILLSGVSATAVRAQQAIQAAVITLPVAIAPGDPGGPIGPA